MGVSETRPPVTRILTMCVDPAIFYLDAPALNQSARDIVTHFDDVIDASAR